MQKAGTTVQKGVSKGRRTCPHRHVPTQEEEGPEEVAAHMCLYVTILLCSIKMLVKQGAFVFMRIDSHPVHSKLYYS